jgi:hypothetical protein
MAGEFPRAPAASATRRKKRDMGVFFWFVFLHVEENEHFEKRGAQTGTVETFQIRF